MRHALALSLAVFAATPARPAEPPAFTLHPLLLTGETAAGVEPDLVDVVGAHEDIFNTGPFVGGPSIGLAGGVGIVGRFGGDGDPATPDASGGAVWRHAGGALVLVARTGQVAPGTPGSPFIGFPEFSPATPADHGEGLAFAGTVRGADGLGRGGLWSSRAGALEKLLLEGEPLPGAPSGSTAGRFAFAARGRSVVVEAGWCMGGGCAFRDEGLFRASAAGFTPVVKRGDPAPGHRSDVVFDELGSANTGPVHVWNASEEGRVIFNGYVRGRRIDEKNNEGIWLEGPAGLALLVREGDKVPGKQGYHWGAGSGLRAFGDFTVMRAHILTANGLALWGATIHNSRWNRVDGVWTNRTGVVTQVVQTVRRDAGIAGQPPQSLASPAPGFPAGHFFRQVFAGRMNASGDIYLDADVADEADSTNPDPVPAIFRVRPGSSMPELLARRGGPVPGLPGAVLLEPQIGRLFDSGHYLWTARLESAGQPGKAAFLTLPDGTTRLLFRSGDAVDASGNGSDLRVLADFATDADPRGGGPRVEQVFEMSFADGSAGVFAGRLEP